MFFILLLLSFLGGFLSGLLGVGGAVVLIPLMYSVPPILGAGQLSMHEVAGITMVQVLIASLVGFLCHQKGGHIHQSTTLAIGLPMGLLAFAGASLSKYMSELLLLSVFFFLVVAAFFLLLKKGPGESGECSGDFYFNIPASVMVGGSVGLASGIVGAGGGFIIIPLMIKILKVPIRTAVGSSLGVVFIGAFMGSIGKVLTLQVEWLYLIPVVAGSIPAAICGSRISRKAHPTLLRYMLLVIVFLVMINTLKDLLT